MRDAALDISPDAMVLDGVSNQRHRFNGGMGMQVIHPSGAKGIGTSIFPDVGARAAVTTKLDGVEVGRARWR
jgi:hypothetical protein